MATGLACLLCDSIMLVMVHCLTFRESTLVFKSLVDIIPIVSCFDKFLACLTTVLQMQRFQASNVMGRWTWMDLEGDRLGLFQDTSPAFAQRNWGTARETSVGTNDRVTVRLAPSCRTTKVAHPERGRPWSSDACGHIITAKAIRVRQVFNQSDYITYLGFTFPKKFLCTISCTHPCYSIFSLLFKSRKGTQTILIVFSVVSHLRSGYIRTA
jgi:hypothetical protein